MSSALQGGWDQSQIPESSRASQTSSGQPETIRPTGNTSPQDTTQNQPTTPQQSRSPTFDPNTATEINEAVRNYHDRSAIEGPWPHQYHFASMPLHQVESKSPDFEK